MKNFLKISLCLLGASMLLTACDNDDKWTPGPEDTEIGVDAYFPSQSTSVILSPLDPLEITTTIKRVDTSSAVSIPMTVTCTSSGLNYPASVDFAAGQATAQYVIDCSGLPVGEFQTVVVELPENQVDIYGPGMPSLSISVIVAEWKVISDNVTYYYTEGSGNALWPSTKGVMYNLDNTTYYRLTDFFGTGLEVMFEAKTSGLQAFMPMTNAYLNNDDYDSWYLYDEANNDWPVYYPGGQDNLGITYFYTWGTSSYSPMYMIYDESTLYGYISLTNWIDFTDGSGNYEYFWLDFNLKYNPFK